MSKDIRSFFNVVSKKTGSKVSKPDVQSKKSIVIVESDDEDVIKSTPDRSKKSTKTASKRKAQVISSDSEDEKETKKLTTKKTNIHEEKLVPISVDDYFGDKPVKMSTVVAPPERRTEVESHQKSNKKNKTRNPELGIHGDRKFEKTLVDLDKESPKSKKKKSKHSKISVHNDENFEKTLEELDNDDFMNNIDVLDKTFEEAVQKVHSNEAVHSSKKGSPNNNLNVYSNNKGTPDVTKPGKRKQRSDSDGSTPKKTKLDHNDSIIDPDQERHEKKRYSAMLYQKYLHRSGPKHHGQKELPKGKPDCLMNLTFLRTGVLDSMEGEEFENLIKEHGGRVVHAVSKKVNFVVVGDDPGPAKLDKARGYNIPEIDEDKLLDMILQRSGKAPKYTKTQSEESCDSGMGKSVSDSFEHSVSPKKKKKISNEENEKETDKNERSSDKTKPNLEKLEVSSKNNSNKSEKLEIKKEANSTLYSPKKEVYEKKSNKTEKLQAKVEVKEEKMTQKTKGVEIKPNKIKLEEGSESLSTKKQESHNEMLSWTDRYKPKDLKSIIGQQDSASNMNKLKTWLMNWYKNQQPERRAKIPRPSPWAKNDDGAYYQAALLSGPPGVGKTTTATLVSHELGFDVVEFNASDTRSKKLLHEEVAQLLSTTSIAGYASGEKTTTKKRVLLMDEVDGMAGNEDRGGIQELINLIKNTSIPIICMCNDRNHTKMRAFVNYCFDLRFNKPRPQQILSAMMSICFKEGLKITPDALTEVINGTGCDIRQTLNNLSMWTAVEKNLSKDTASKESKNSKKDIVIGPWEVVRAVFTPSEHDTVADKFKLFYYDYSLGPLFVQENYLSVTPNCSKKEVLKRVALTADAISMGDLIDSKIRGSNNWSLLETRALFSSVLPGHYMSGKITSRVNFPNWLGRNSSATKRKRMLGELCTHTRTCISGNKLAMNLDYVVALRDAILNPLKKKGTEGVHDAVEVMKSYNLLREDLTNLIELSQWSEMPNPFDDIAPKVKSAFTRAYNKEAPLLPFSSTAGDVKKKSAKAETDLLGEEEYVDSDTEIEDNVETDAMIKVKTKNDSKNKKDNPNPSTSKSKEKPVKSKDQSKGSKGRATKKGK